MAEYTWVVVVPFELVAYHRPEPVALRVERGDDGDLAGHDGGIGGLQHRRPP
jgi:hypothetical protein